MCGCAPDPPAPAPPPPVAWPPVKGQPFPDLQLVDQTGARVSLSSFKGKVLLVEPVGMNCAGCQAFCGAHRPGIGAFEGVTPQPGLMSVDECVARLGQGATLDDPDVVHVQLLLYSMNMDAPTPADAKRWADHFKMDRNRNRVVLAGEPWLVNSASYEMIPGFFLVDRAFVVVSDSTGHHPKDDLYRFLIPALSKLLHEKR